MPANPLAVAELQLYARHLGRGFTLLAALMSAAAGWRLGGDNTFAAVLLAGLLGGLTVAVAVMLNFIDLAWTAGERRIAAGLACAYVVLLGAEYASHVAFGTSHRQSDIEHATYQTTAYTDTRAGVGDLERTLARLEAKHDWQRSYSTPESYDALIRAAEDAVTLEASRGGCRTKCQAAKEKTASLRAEQAISADRLAVQAEIKLVSKQLADARRTASATRKGESVAQTQAQLFATAATGSLAPTTAAVAWANIGIGAYLSLISTGLGTLFNWLGFHQFGGRRQDRVVSTRSSQAPTPSIATAADAQPTVTPPMLSAAHPAVHHHYTTTGLDLARLAGTMQGAHA